MFLSAYSPLSVIFLIQNFDFETQTLNQPILVSIVLIIAVFFCILLRLSIHDIRSSSPPIKITKVSNQSSELVNYTIPYMVCFIVVNFETINLWISFGWYMSIMYVLSVKTHTIFFNPVLAIFGYNIYAVSYTRDSHEYEGLFLVKGPQLRLEESCQIAELSERLQIVTKRRVNNAD